MKISSGSGGAAAFRSSRLATLLPPDAVPAPLAALPPGHDPLRLLGDAPLHLLRDRLGPVFRHRFPPPVGSLVSGRPILQPAAPGHSPGLARAPDVPHRRQPLVVARQ